MALPISPFFNYLLLVYVIKMSLFDIYYEYELLLKYTFMKILFTDFMLKASKRLNLSFLKGCCHSDGLLKNYKLPFLGPLSLDKSVLIARD